MALLLPYFFNMESGRNIQMLHPLVITVTDMRVNQAPVQASSRCQPTNDDVVVSRLTPLAVFMHCSETSSQPVRYRILSYSLIRTMRVYVTLSGSETVRQRVCVASLSPYFRTSRHLPLHGLLREAIRVE
jgi:hypothetical protein